MFGSIFITIYIIKALSEIYSEGVKVVDKITVKEFFCFILKQDSFVSLVIFILLWIINQKIEFSTPTLTILLVGLPLLHIGLKFKMKKKKEKQAQKEQEDKEKFFRWMDEYFNNEI